MRSITESLLSGTCLSPSFFIAAVTSARLSSGVIATESGGPTTLVGASTSPITLGGEALRSTIVTVSGTGLATTLTDAVDELDLGVVGDDGDLRHGGLRLKGRTTAPSRAGMKRARMTPPLLIVKQQ